MTQTYRAAYIAYPGTTGHVLTGPEQANLPDDELIAAAMEELDKVGEFRLASEIIIGDWTE